MDKSIGKIKMDHYYNDWLGTRIVVAEMPLLNNRFLSIVADDYSADVFDEIELDIKTSYESLFGENDELIEDLDDFEGDDREIITVKDYLVAKHNSSVDVSNLSNVTASEMIDLCDHFIDYMKERI